MLKLSWKSLDFSLTNQHSTIVLAKLTHKCVPDNIEASRQVG